MLSNSGGVPSSALSESAPRSSTAHALRGSSSQAVQRDGYASSSLAEHRVAPTPPQHQHAFNAPRPSLQPLQEYHSGFADDALDSPFAPNHRRQNSFPNLLPLTIRSRSPSPTRKASRLSEQMPFTGDGRSGKADSPRGGLAGWLGMSTNPEDRSPNSVQQAKGSSRDATPDATPTRLRRSVTGADTTAAKSAVSATASRFMSAISRFTQAPTSPTVHDELFNLNVDAALFPANSPSDRDAFSPAAFKNLQTNATGLLTKMQNAYREQVIVARDIQAERGAMRDELEEAETRAEHLKMQLEGMSRKAAEYEKGMQQLLEELTAEKKSRAEERLAREKGISLMVEGSMVSEDLGVDEDQMRRKWRKSGGTVKSDMSFDTDEESMESSSVFSRSRSPTIPAGNFESSMADGTPSQRKPSTLVPGKPKAAGSQLNALQKIIKGISAEPEDTSPGVCDNCRGQDARFAWDTVSLLRDENRQLKQRVGQLEVAVEGALDLVNGVGL